MIVADSLDILQHHAGEHEVNSSDQLEELGVVRCTDGHCYLDGLGQLSLLMGSEGRFEFHRDLHQGQALVAELGAGDDLVTEHLVAVLEHFCFELRILDKTSLLVACLPELAQDAGKLLHVRHQQVGICEELTLGDYKEANSLLLTADRILVSLRKTQDSEVLRQLASSVLHEAVDVLELMEAVALGRPCGIPRVGVRSLSGRDEVEIGDAVSQVPHREANDFRRSNDDRVTHVLAGLRLDEPLDHQEFVELPSGFPLEVVEVPHIILLLLVRAHA